MEERARTQALRDLIDEQLQIQEAANYEITVSSEDLQRRLEDIARQNNTDLAGLTRDLAANGISITTLRSQIEADIVWSRLIGGLYGSRLRISEVEIRETQERIAANASRPQYQISEIFLPAESEADFNEMEQGALRLLQEMQRGAPFPLVARQFSRSPSAVAGGDIGWISVSELAPELSAVAQQLEPGQVSLPIRTPRGVYILAVRDRRAGAPSGATSIVSLRQVTAPATRANALERMRRAQCNALERETASVQDANMVDLGQATESDLSPVVQQRISGVAAGNASAVVTEGDQASVIFVCTRQTGGANVPSRQEIEGQLREAELAMLAERYLRSLRREATIITRQ
jgi:peptidyl-prolyl cis-trans isomerase SurA